MAKIVWTRAAVDCLEHIHDYIAADRPDAAGGGVAGIYEKVQLLRNHPLIGQRYEPIADRQVREILYGHYRIAYLVAGETRVEILGIFHAAMDIERHLH